MAAAGLCEELRQAWLSGDAPLFLLLAEELQLCVDVPPLQLPHSPVMLQALNLRSGDDHEPSLIITLTPGA